MPARDIQHLTVDEVLVLHEQVIVRFGGSPGARDLGLLESALYRPQTGYYADLAEMAAALCESLWRNHPFIDGNKRVAFFATEIFLRINGWHLRIDDKAAHVHLMRLVDRGCLDFEHLLAWIRKHLARMGRGGPAS